MNNAKPNNINFTSGKLELITSLEGQPINGKVVQQCFTPEFVEKHKHGFLFNGVIETLNKGVSPYTIIQELLEILEDIKKEYTHTQVDLQQYYELEKNENLDMTDEQNQS